MPGAVPPFAVGFVLFPDLWVRERTAQTVMA